MHFATAFQSILPAGPPKPQDQEELRTLLLKPARGSDLASFHTSMAFEKPSEEEADRLLVDIWNAAFPDEPVVSGAPGQHWRRLGFQSPNPCSDVRGGRLCLQQLHYMATQHPGVVRRLVKESQEHYHPFACSCFNLTQMVAVFFHLRNGMCASPVSGAPKADSRQLHNLLALARTEESSVVVLDELFLCIGRSVARHMDAYVHTGGRQSYGLPPSLAGGECIALCLLEEACFTRRGFAGIGLPIQQSKRWPHQAHCQGGKPRQAAGAAHRRLGLAALLGSDGFVDTPPLSHPRYQQRQSRSPSRCGQQMRACRASLLSVAQRDSMRRNSRSHSCGHACVLPN